MLLNVNGVECRYGSRKILENVSLTVKEGDFVGILGPNGSGKTTLLKSIGRTLKPYKGAVLLNDKDIYSLKSIDVAKQLAVVPQDNSISFNFTALEVVMMGRSPHLTRFEMESEKDMAIAQKVMNLTNTWQSGAAANKRVKRRRTPTRHHRPRSRPRAQSSASG